MSTLERINNCLEELGYAKATHRDQELKDLKLDSLDWLELSIMLEDEFSIEIPEEDFDIEKITTVKQAIEYIDQAVKEQEK